MASVFKRGKKTKGSKYVASWYDAEHEVWKQTVAYTDRGLSVSHAQRLEHESALRREGFTSNVRDESIRPIAEQVEEYITHVVSEGGDPNYVSQLRRRIERVLDAVKAKRLLDVEPGRVQTALLQLRKRRGFEKDGGLLSVTTRNEYLNSMMGFTRWAHTRRKLDHDPLACLSQADERDVDKMHPRRGLTVDEVAALLDAALRRPEAELRTIRTGPNKGQLGTKVREPVLAAARQTGIERRMAYMLIVWTGLRRSEMAKLQWRDVLLDVATPYIQLRPEMNKAKRADVIPLHPQAVAELQAFRPADALPKGLVVPKVPDMKVMKLDLAFAGIDYGDQEMGFADLHAQRMTLNTMLASQGIAPRVRQAQLRHSDPRLTEVTYFDKSLFVKPQADDLSRAAAIPVKQNDDPEADPLAQLVHNGGGVSGLLGSQPGTDGERGRRGSEAAAEAENAQNQADFGTQRHDPASGDAGSDQERVMRVELTTFTLAT